MHHYLYFAYDDFVFNPYFNKFDSIIIQVLNLAKLLEEILFKIIILLLFTKDFLLIIKYKSGNQKKIKKI